MPAITRVFIKSGLIFFILSLLTGIALHIDLFPVPLLPPLFWHMLMVGWITQIIMGVSMWMFPGRNKEESFKNQGFAWIAYALLNLGLILRIISEPMVVISEQAIWKVLLGSSAVLQFLAVLSYIIEIWPRVYSRKQHRKKKKKVA